MAYPFLRKIGDFIIARIRRLYIRPSPRFSYSSASIGIILSNTVDKIWVALCDVDNSGTIDITDISAIMAARNTRSSGPADARDADGDGVITAIDASLCVLQCTNPRCAP